MSSCSKSGEISNQNSLSQEGELIKRVIITQGGNQSTSYYNYSNGNKLQSVVNGNYKTLYFYNNNLIVNMKYYSNDILQYEAIYDYDSNERMIKRLSYDYINNTGYKANYFYNSDGTVSVSGFEGNFTTQTNQIVDNKVYLLANGNVEKIEQFVVVNGANHIKTQYYTYDDKNSIYNSILGFNKIKKWDVGTSGNTNNTISILNTTTENSSTYTDTILYTYNSKGFPITESWSSINSEFFYQ